MDVTAQDVRSAAFSGTRHVYDRREVDGFLVRLAEVLEHYERDVAASQRRLRSLEQALESAQQRIETLQHLAEQRSPAPTTTPVVDELRDLERRAFDVKTDALAEAASIRRKAEREAAEITARAREATAASEQVPAAGAADTFEDTLGWIRTLAEAEEAASLVGAARQEAKRIREVAEEAAIEVTAQAARDQEAVASSLATQIEARRIAAEAEADQLVEDARQQGLEVLAAAEEAAADRQRSAEETERQMLRARDTAQREAEEVVADARVEGEAILEEARRAAAQATETAQREVRAMDRRVRQIRSALRDAESRFQSLAANTTAEFSLLGDLIDLDVHQAESPVESTRPRTDQPDGDDETPVAGFYERRLAGLRSRLEASGDSVDES